MVLKKTSISLKSMQIYKINGNFRNVVSAQVQDSGA